MGVQNFPTEEELVRLLDSRHLRFLSELEARLLAASEFGYSVERSAVGLARSEATVRRHLANLKHRVFDFLEFDESTTLLNHWTRRHFPCCTAEAQKMIANCQILTAGAQQQFELPSKISGGGDP